MLAWMIKKQGTDISMPVPFSCLGLGNVESVADGELITHTGATNRKHDSASSELQMYPRCQQCVNRVLLKKAAKTEQAGFATGSPIIPWRTSATSDQIRALLDHRFFVRLDNNIIFLL